MNATLTRRAPKVGQQFDGADSPAGYYVVKGDHRYFVSTNVNEPALNRVCEKVCSDTKGWNYWVDYCHGPDVHGNPAWANVDMTDRFI